MLKSILKCTFAVLCFATSNINAQDFGCCCCDSGPFNGFYVGGNLGIISHNAHRNDLDGFLTDNSGWTTIDNGFIGGIQGGYDWQCGSRVLGLLVDWDGTSNRRNVLDDPNGGGNGGVDTHLHWISTIRARAGLAVCDSLIYLTGGAAVTGVRTTWSRNADRFSHDETRWGWVGGFGAEYKVCDCWSFGAELLYLNFENDNRSFNSGANRFTFGHSDSAVTGRLFANYSLSNLFSSY